MRKLIKCCYNCKHWGYHQSYDLLCCKHFDKGIVKKINWIDYCQGHEWSEDYMDGVQSW